MKKGKFRYCDDCKVKLNKKRDHVRKPCPYGEDVLDDMKKVDLCNNCADERASDI